MYKLETNITIVLRKLSGKHFPSLDHMILPTTQSDTTYEHLYEKQYIANGYMTFKDAITQQAMEVKSWSHSGAFNITSV